MVVKVCPVKKTLPLPSCNFRLGTTSYILPDDVLPNVRFLAEKVQDVELLIYKLDDRWTSLLSPRTVGELADLAEEHHLSYTVHLPLSLDLTTNDETRRESLDVVHRIMERTRPLDPWAYVVHLDARDRAPPPTPGGRDRGWLDRCLSALEPMAKWAGGAEYLALENLEHRPHDFLGPILKSVRVSLCVDVGHLWLDGENPIPLPDEEYCVRVVHLHGVDTDGRDHRSLACVTPQRLDPVVQWLASHFSGVLTLEVFSLQDFLSSVEALQRSMKRVITPDES
jgi:sugar phosphate isomerase/epimerase